MSPVAQSTIQLTRFLDHHIGKLLDTKSFSEIAGATGLKETTLRSITAGRARLPLHMVAQVASGVEVDPTHLMFLALQQFAAGPVLDLILDTGAASHGIEGPAEGADGDFHAQDFGAVIQELVDLSTVAKSAAEAALTAVRGLDARIAELAQKGNEDDGEDRQADCARELLATEGRAEVASARIETKRFLP